MVRSVACCLLLSLPLACAQAEPPPEPEIPVRVGTVAIDRHHAPVVILEEENGPRVLPIWIGTAEASSISSQINDQPPPRPNSHDMARRVIDQLDAEVERVVVTELRQGTYYALLSLRANGRLIEIDVRPSDGIALALRTEAPILVRASVFEEAGEALEMEEPGRPISWFPRGAQPDGSSPATVSLNL
jgi:bifunctional DNase/RNase